VKSYVYLISNNVNGKCYVGKSNNPTSRWRDHKFDAARARPRTLIGKALAKYGVDSFEFKVVSEYLSQESAFAAESQLITELCTLSSQHGYNLDSGGWGGTTKSTETREKIRVARLGTKLRPESRAKLSAYLRGHTLSEEARAKISATKKGSKQSPETIEKRRQSALFYWSDPSFQEKRRQSHAAAMRRPEVRTKISLAEDRKRQRRQAKDEQRSA
jgi:group I intron endonuclease